MKDRLTEKDFDLIFPGKINKIGRLEYKFFPFSMKKIGEIKSRFKTDLEQAGFTLENLGARVTELTPMILEKGPDIVADALGMHPEDFDKLPAALQVNLADELIEVNLESFGGLEKNLLSLMGKAPILVKAVSLMLSSSSSARDTDSETSRNTAPENSDASSEQQLEQQKTGS